MSPMAAASGALRRIDSKIISVARPSHEARQALRSTGTRDQPQVGFGLADRGAAIVDHQPVIAGERQLAAAAQGMAVDCGDQWLREALDFRERGLAAPRHLRDAFQRGGILAVETT